jgi:hypothetical protein
MDEYSKVSEMAPDSIDLSVLPDPSIVIRKVCYEGVRQRGGASVGCALVEMEDLPCVVTLVVTQWQHTLPLHDLLLRLPSYYGP